MPSPLHAEHPIQYGFKRISLSNLCQPDTHSPYASRPNRDNWLRACLAPQLESSVPEEVAFLFEVARGSMAYAVFFLPLASLAAEQCYRVLEVGARRRCDDLGLKGNRVKGKKLQDLAFANAVATLTAAEAFQKRDVEAWTTMPFLRNRFSHPKSQTILSLDSALDVLAFTAALLNRLFRVRASNERH
jgi:hypothetical protein